MDMAHDYRIGSGFSEQELKAAHWWVRHGIVVRRIAYGLLIGWIILTWGYVFWSLLDAYILSWPRESRIQKIIQANQQEAARLAHALPEALNPSSVYLLANTDGRQDIFTRLHNPNTDWWADFDYAFSTDIGVTTTLQHGFILPESETVLTELGFKQTEQAQDATLILQNMRWHRIYPDQVEGAYKDFAARRLQMEATDISYVPDAPLAEKTGSQTTFTLLNHSSYGFWSVDAIAILYRLEQPIAITKLNQRELKPGETRTLSINWGAPLGAVSKTEIIASTNILDANNYLPADRF